MDMFIEKNILLDEIIKLNNFILTYQNTKEIRDFVETLDYLRNNTNQNTDIGLLNDVLTLIHHIYIDVEASQSMVYDKRDLNIINEILYGLFNSKLKIKKFLEQLEHIDSLIEVINEMNI